MTSALNPEMTVLGRLLAPFGSAADPDPRV